MDIAEVIYKDKKYQVYNPGIIISEEFKFVDQLDKNLITVDSNKKCRYIYGRYGITIEDYYIIVVYLGDPLKRPKCKCRRCENFTKFDSKNLRYRSYCSRSCVATETNLSGMENGSNKWIITNRINWENPFKGEKGSKMSRDLQNKLVKEGRHPWSGENGSNLQKTRLKNGSHPFLKKENRISGSKKLFENKGDSDDICTLYLAKENKNPKMIKIGVTINIESRKGHFGNYYNEYKILIRDSRIKVAEIEYKVKLNFINKSIKGDEYFPIDIEKEIIDYVNSLYNK